jgi:hypothetical protein
VHILAYGLLSLVKHSNTRATTRKAKKRARQPKSAPLPEDEEEEGVEGPATGSITKRPHCDASVKQESASPMNPLTRSMVPAFADFSGVHLRGVYIPVNPRY